MLSRRTSSGWPTTPGGTTSGVCGLHRLSGDGAGEDLALAANSNHSYPSWAPDQSRLVFFDYSNNSIQTIAPDGSGLRTIATGEFPAWSPAAATVLPSRDASTAANAASC